MSKDEERVLTLRTSPEHIMFMLALLSEKVEKGFLLPDKEKKELLFFLEDITQICSVVFEAMVRCERVTVPISKIKS